MNERVNTELSATARQVIADARGADDPTAEDEARVKARWLAGIAAGAGVSSLSEAVRAAASTGWGLKAGALAAALAAATAGVYLGWPQLSESAGRAVPANPAPEVAEDVVSRQQEVAPAVAPPPVVVAVTEPVAAAPAPVESAVPAAAADVPPAARGVAAAARPRPVAADRTPAGALEPVVPAVASAVGGQLGEEITLISQIRGTLQAGAPVRALEQLADYRRRFDEPNLGMEADALRVDALCQAGQPDAARAAATLFARNWPASPLQQRVSGACP